MPHRRLIAVALLSIGLALPAAAAPLDDPFWDAATLLPDPAGLRKRWEGRGVTVSLQHTTEAWSNLRGGIRRGVTLGSLVQAGITLDTEKAGLWSGGTVQVNALHVGGRFPSQDLIGNLQPATSIEARRGAYLAEAWVEQALPGKIGSLRAGQLRADVEFLSSGYVSDPEDAPSYANAGALFVNASFGFPAITGLALPNGGPAYPFAVPGARLKLTPSDRISLLLGAFSGTPATSAFTFRGGMLLIGETQYAVNQPVDATGLPGIYRLGWWHHTDRFADQRRDIAGLSLADPLSTGVALRHRGTSGVYAMADQLLWQSGTLRAESLGVFGRVIVAPGDRVMADLQINGGLTWKGMFSARPDDAAGLGVSWVRIGGAARGLDRDTALFGGSPYPVRDGEVVIEATYQVTVAGWWQVQPSVQYVLRPAGGVPDPRRAGRILGDALVVGLRSVVTF